MIEIILMVVLAKKLASIAESKYRSKGWAALGPALWILGEVLGMVLMVAAGNDGPEMYVGALIGAVLGAGISWVIVNSLSPNEALADYGGVSDGVVGGAYDPSNPYNAPGVHPGANPYQAAPGQPQAPQQHNQFPPR